jgi:molybdate transport system substrate-binding protein
MRLRRAAFLLGLVAALGACNGSASPTPSVFVDGTVPPAALTIYAAASLKGAIEAAIDAYRLEAPNVTITLSTDSSAALETQIEQGAPADVFLSADTSNPQKLVIAGLAAGDRVEFAGNGLTIIVPSDNPAHVSTAADLARAGVRIVAAGDEVPITKYVEQLVRNLAGTTDDPDGFIAAYAANIVSKEDNVKAVVAKIELGEGDAAIVYATDAKTSNDVAPIAVLAATNVVATYAGVALRRSSDVLAAQAFLVWLAGPVGQEVLAGFGFLAPPA